MSSENRDLGNKLRLFRKHKLFLTQVELAEKLGISQELISMCEMGHKNPNQVIDKISNEYNIKKEAIIEFEPNTSFNFYGNIENNYIQSSIHNDNIKSLIEIKDSMTNISKLLDRLIKDMNS